jgi:hypothetical protein
MIYCVVVAVEERKSNLNVNEEKVIKIVAEYKRNNVVAISKTSKTKCSGLIKK